MRYVLLSCLAAVFSLLSFHSLTGFNVQGKVTDDKGKPVAGAAVNEKGTKSGTTTDGNGEFKITVSSEKSVLVFSAVGFGKKEIHVKGRNMINVSLKASEQDLEEVVVVGGLVLRPYHSAAMKIPP